MCLHLGLNFKIFTSFGGVKVPNVYYLFAICRGTSSFCFETIQEENRVLGTSYMPVPGLWKKNI